MTSRAFDQTSVDVQATPAEPVRPEDFDFGAYADYEASRSTVAATGRTKWERWREHPDCAWYDGAFSAETDPSPNRPESFAEAFTNTGIVVNSRIVGDCDTVVETVKKLWAPGMKLIVVTYCSTPEEQAEAYDRVHEICR